MKYYISIFKGRKGLETTELRFTEEDAMQHAIDIAMDDAGLCYHATLNDGEPVDFEKDIEAALASRYDVDDYESQHRLTASQVCKL